MTDGVVEARSPSRQLFGFEGVAAISRRSAEEIARAALQFGQEDDITVITIRRVPDVRLSAADKANAVPPQLPQDGADHQNWSSSTPTAGQRGTSD